MEVGGRRASQKRLAPNQRVSGSVGEFIEGPSKRRRRQRWFGHIIRAVGERKYLVRFDNGEERELPSAVLKVEHIVASIPPDTLIPTPQNAHEEAMMESAFDELIQDGEEVEDMPVDTPELEEAELAVAVDAEGEDVEPPPEPDTNGRMPGQLPSSAGDVILSKDYHSVKKAAKEKIAALVGQEVTVGTRKNGSMKWKVVEKYEPPDEDLLEDYKSADDFGFIDFCSSKYSLKFKKSEVLLEFFLQLSFIDWKEKVKKMNDAIASASCKCKKFSDEEFLIGLALMIGSSEFSQKGVELFSSKDQVCNDDDEEDFWRSISPSPQFEQYMPFSRFKDFRRFLPEIHADSTKKEDDPWYQFSEAVEEFNFIRRTRVQSSSWICADETMSAWRPRTTPLGGLPNISFVVRKPEPLGKIV